MLKTPSSGVDVSHRGADPGFIKVENATTLLFPDYAGNRHFNTLGNLTRDPRAGLLFIDFERGHYRQLTGDIEIVWSGSDIDQFSGAERVLRFHLNSVSRTRPLAGNGQPQIFYYPPPRVS